MHIFLWVLLWLNSHLITQAHLSFIFSFLSLCKILRVGIIPMQLNCWKHPCINQHQRGKIQTQTSKECKEKSNPVRVNITSQLPPPRICRERKAEGQASNTLSVWVLLFAWFYCLFPLDLEVLATKGNTAYTMRVPASLGTNPEVALLWYQPLNSCNSSSAALSPCESWRMSMTCSSNPRQTWKGTSTT